MERKLSPQLEKIVQQTEKQMEQQRKLLGTMKFKQRVLPNKRLQTGIRGKERR